MVPTVKNTFKSVVVVSVIPVAFLLGRTLGAGHPSLKSIERRLIARVGDPGLAGGIGGAQEANPNVAPVDIFENVLEHVQREFVEINDIPTSKINNGAVSRMYASLDDPKTMFLEADMRKMRQDALEGNFAGIGAVLTITKAKKADIDYRYVTVVDVMPGSPAVKSGILSGDRITEIDGHWIIAYSILADIDRIRGTKEDDAKKREQFGVIEKKFTSGLTYPKALRQLSTGQGKTYKISLERGGQAKPIEVQATTAETKVEPVAFSTVGNHVGYLQVRQFNAKATTAFDSALNKFAQSGGAKGLILDLRRNPGGMTAEEKTHVDGYTSARKLLARLTPGGTVAQLERKVGGQREALKITSENRIKTPLVVLVDHGTANLSEMVASALREGSKARLVGAHTFGDNVLQLFAPLKNGTGVEIATRHMFGASGADLSKGLEPDVIVINSDSKTDVGLQRAIAELG